MKHNTFLFAGLLLFSISIYSQDADTDSKNTNNIEGAEKVDSPQAVGDKVRIKDGTTTLIEINNEGSAGSILLPSVGSVLSGSKLYSNGVNLFWGTSQLNGSNGAAEIDDLSDAKSDGTSLFLGSGAGANDDGDNLNTAIGFNALNRNTTGGFNTAIGFYALSSNTSVGYQSLRCSDTPSNNTGQVNSAFGYQALYSNTSGDYNTANGNFTLYDNTTGNHNTANGYTALRFNETGSNNTANGSGALLFNDSGSNNTANGYNAIFSNITGIRNTASGSETLYKNLHGDYNTAIGYKTLYNNTGKWNTALGRQALEDVTTGTGNIGIGYDAQVPSAAGSYQVRIGNSQISHAGIQVAWTITSDKIWKEQIRELPHGLDMLMKLKPVDYIRKNSGDRTREMGFIAQDMEEVLTNINYYDQGFLTKDDGGHLNLRYNDIIALLTKGIQEQQVMIEELKMQNEEIRRQNLELVKRQSKIESLLEREKVTQTRKKEFSRLMD